MPAKLLVIILFLITTKIINNIKIKMEIEKFKLMPLCFLIPLILEIKNL